MANSGLIGVSQGLSRLKTTRRGFLAGSAALAASLSARGVLAADYPSAPVRLIVSTGAGSGTDIIGRVMAKQLTQQIGSPFIIENHTGAGGVIGNDIVAQASPDGYTGVIMDTGMSITANMFKSLPYNSLTDFTPITQFSRVPLVLVVNPSLKVNSLADLIAYAKANPGKLNFGSSGVGGSIHIYFERFKAAAGIDITHIPYDGGSTMLTAALRDDVQLLMTAITTTKSYVKNKQLTAIAATSDARAPSMPDVPTMKEAGLTDLVMYSWSGLGGPKGLPDDVVAKLNSESVKALADPAVKDWFTSQDAETVGSSAADFTKFFHGEIERWGKVIKDANISLNQ